MKIVKNENVSRRVGVESVSTSRGDQTSREGIRRVGRGSDE